eukprot:3306629-Prymnesium_polylepis.1
MAARVTAAEAAVAAAWAAVSSCARRQPLSCATSVNAGVGVGFIRTAACAHATSRIQSCSCDARW